MNILFPGRHHLLTDFQFKYLYRLKENGLEHEPDVNGKSIGFNEPVKRVIFAVTSANRADSFLIVRLKNEAKSVLVESVNDDPRAIQYRTSIEVAWTDRGGAPLLDRQILRITRDVDFIPEGGQSLTTAQQEVIERLARQIVNQMELTW